jgi:thiol:disulfide interchange protein DsbD
VGLAGVVMLLASAMTAVAADPPANVVSARLEVRGTEAAVEVTILPEWHVNGHEPRDEFLVPTTVAVVPPPGVTAGAVRYPEPVERRLPFAGDHALLLYEGRVRFAVPLEGAVPPGSPFRATLRYQACDASRCLPPRTLELSTTAAAASGSLLEEDASGGGQVEGWIARFGIVPTLALVALLGVALNLTPCVYPLISVTIAFFAGRSGSAESPAVRRALLYVLGICSTFTALGMTAALTGSLFGAALQQPVVLAGVAVVLVLLAASNFGLYTFRLPPALAQRLGRVGEGGLGAFVMGLTMGLVASPCVGPVIAALLVFVGSQQSVWLGFALFFALGLGMGSPYLLLAALAGRLRRLPRGGAWLQWVEHVLGFVLLAMALWFVAPLLPSAWTRVATALLLVAAAAVLGFRAADGGVAFRWARRALGIGLVGLALGGFFEADAQSPIAWKPFSDDAFERALAARRPVLLDFQADWCLPCREMDRTTFRDPDVVRAAEPFAPFKVDVTLGDDDANAVMERFAVSGVPTYLVLRPDGSEHERLVGFVSAERMRRALETVVLRPAGAEARG